jgi:hypothetical protein
MRAALMKRHIGESDMGLGEIVDLLGYSRTSNFSL